MEFLQNYSSKISMSEDYFVTLKELEKFTNKTAITIYHDLLHSFGFTGYEYYINGELKSSIVLNPNVTNHVKRNFVSTVGSIKNELLD